MKKSKLKKKNKFLKKIIKAFKIDVERLEQETRIELDKLKESKNLKKEKLL